MSVLTKMFGGKYNDAQLVTTVERSIEDILKAGDKAIQTGEMVPFDAHIIDA